MTVPEHVDPHRIVPPAKLDQAHGAHRSILGSLGRALARGVDLRQKSRFWTGVIALAVSTTLFLVACQPAAISAGPVATVVAASPGSSVASGAASGAIDPSFEAKVLEVIRKNPQVILESVAKYNQDQAGRQREIRQAFARDTRRNPQNVIGSSPTKGTGKQALLVEFSDFQCPYCQRAVAPVEEFMKTYGDRVTLVFKHFPLTNIHAQAKPAALAAWAAGQQGKFWEFHDGLFQNQQRLGDGFYKELAQGLGLDVARFDRDRQGQAAQKAIAADLSLAETLGLEGTPTFLMNGQPLESAPSVEAFQAAFEKAKS